MWKHKAKLRYVDIYVFIHTIYFFFYGILCGHNFDIIQDIYNTESGM